MTSSTPLTEPTHRAFTIAVGRSGTASITRLTNVDDSAARFVSNSQNRGYIGIGIPLVLAGGVAVYGLGAGAIGALTSGGGLTAAQILQPGGQMIGNRGTSQGIRELERGLPEA